MFIQTFTDTARQLERYIHRQTHVYTDTDRQLDSQTYRKIYRQTDRLIGQT